MAFSKQARLICLVASLHNNQREAVLAAVRLLEALNLEHVRGRHHLQRRPHTPAREHAEGRRTQTPYQRDQSGVEMDAEEVAAGHGVHVQASLCRAMSDRPDAGSSGQVRWAEAHVGLPQLRRHARDAPPWAVIT